MKRAKRALEPMEIPDFAAEELGVKGINANTALLRGMVAKDLERLRDRADRARCPILVLVDEAPLDFGPDAGPMSIQRIERLGMAASKLGAPAVAVELSAAKIIFLAPGNTLFTSLPRQISISETEELIKKNKGEFPPNLLSKLEYGAKACRQGVARTHVLDGGLNEALLSEVFSHEGIGTMV
ncbi:MAG: hypothetical protein EBR07_01250, partial [Planctomycetes bacterium]|nr:hypothetical protein [Planctomycetota bacterium]